jgi:hypothetical protein
MRLREVAGDAVLRRDLSRVRVADPGYDVAAGAARFDAAIASGAPLPADPALVGSGGFGMIAAGSLLAVAIAAIAVTRPWAEPPAIAEAPAIAPATDEPIAPVIERAVPEVAPAPARIDPVIATDPPSPPRPAKTRPRRTADPASAAPPPQPESPDPADELKATKAAAHALASDPARALELVAKADREFPRGMFDEDRRGIAALAELSLGRASGRAHASAYLRAHPKGTYAERLLRELGN